MTDKDMFTKNHYFVALLAIHYFFTYQFYNSWNSVSMHSLHKIAVQTALDAMYLVSDCFQEKDNFKVKIKIRHIITQISGSFDYNIVIGIICIFLQCYNTPCA